MSRQLQHILILILLAVCGSVAHATETERFATDETGREEYAGTEKADNLVTWVYDGTSFTPVAKVTGGERYTIVHDYLGTPVQAYDSYGNLVWEVLLDVYGGVMDSLGDRSLVPFRYQGQYEDAETGLYYNRFRYYSPQMGMYISSDTIGLAGNNPTLYGYVSDVNAWLDVWGLYGWSNHGYKHFPRNNDSWSTIVNSTKNGPAKYKPGINIQELERNVWENGKDVTNGKTWKVMEFDEVIGASEGKQTKYVRVEMSADTIHGHPISEKEFRKLTKCN